jgi:hypothetical protein
MSFDNQFIDRGYGDGQKRNLSAKAVPEPVGGRQEAHGATFPQTPHWLPGRRRRRRTRLRKRGRHAIGKLKQRNSWGEILQPKKNEGQSFDWPSFFVWRARKDSNLRPPSS